MPCPLFTAIFFLLTTASIKSADVFSGLAFSPPSSCPKGCTCSFHNQVPVTADCSNSQLQTIPRILPDTLTSLDLSANWITCVSASELKNLPYLRTLDLQSNRLESLPSDVFSHLSNLQSLNISRNKISSLDAYSFRNLTSLRTLNLNTNLLFVVPDTLPTSVFQDLFKLTELDLQSNVGEYSSPELCYPDTALAYLYNLEKLHIDGLPACSRLGVGFRNLSRLRVLDFGNSIRHICQIMTLPSDFFANIRTTEPLEVGFLNCNLNSIHPYAFARLPSLRSLVLAGNHYLNLEGFLVASTSFKATQLKRLDISAIKKSFAVNLTSAHLKHLQNTSLEILVMRGNCFINVLSDVPSRLPKSLREWDISDNRLIKLDFRESLNWLVNLNFLNMSVQNRVNEKRNNKNVAGLKRIAGIISSASFQSVSSPSRKLSRAGKIVSSMMKNRDLDLVWNSLGDSDRMAAGQWSRHVSGICERYSPNEPLSMFNKTLVLSRPEWLKDYRWTVTRRPNITTLSTDGRTVTMPSVPLPLPRNLRWLLASKMNLGISIDAMEITSNNVLEYVDLSSNFLWCFGGPLLGLPTVSVFDLSNNFAIAIHPEFFAFMISLKKLMLNFNSIGFSLELDLEGKTFSSLTQLEYLDLSHTDIHSLSPKAFIFNTRLKTILLQNNALTTFTPEISQLAQLEYLDLSFNDLPRLSSENMVHLDKITQTSNVTINLQHNPLLCDCSSLNFLNWFQKSSVTFAKRDLYHCKFINGTFIPLDRLGESMDSLWRICWGPTALLLSSVSFSIMAIIWTAAAAFSLYRYKIFFYAYVSKQRFFCHVSGHEQKRKQDVFLVFDDQDVQWRRHVLDVLLPNLSSRGITSHVSELGVYEPSAGRHVREVVQEAILYGRKTLVLLTEDIFLDDEHQLAVTMAKIVQDMSGSKILMFLGAEKLKAATLPVHLYRLLRDSRIINYMPERSSFWTQLIGEIKK